MPEDQNIPDNADGAGDNTRNTPFPGMGTPIPSKPEVKMPPVSTTHRFFDDKGQPTPIIDRESEPEQSVVPQKQPVAQPEPPSTPDYKLWQQLNKSELYTKDYNSFKSQFNNPTSIDKLHQQLSDLELYTKPKEDFQKQFFNNLPSKEVTEANSFINDYLNSPKANKAIDQITSDNFYKNIAQQQQGSSQGKDATRIQQPIPIRLPSSVQQDRQDYSAQATQNPNLFRQVLEVAKKQNPSDAPALNKAAFVAHANTIPHSDAVVKYYADKMGTGEYDYDMNTNQIIKPTGAIDSFFSGMTKHSQDQDAYDYLTTHSDDDIIKYLNDKGSADPFKPVMKAKGTLSSFAEATGANAVPLTKFGLPALILNPYGATAAAFGAAIGAGAGSQDFAHAAYKNTLEESYHEFMNNHPDADPHIALEKAKEDANTSAKIAAAQGFVLAGAGALAKEVEFYPVRYSKKNLNALVDIGNNVKTLAKHAVPEISTQAGIAAAAKALNNAQQGKVTSSGIVDDAGAMALFTAGMIGLKVPGAFKGGGLSEAGKANLMDLYAKSPEPMVDAALTNAVKHEAMTPEQAGELKVEITAHKKATEGKPDLTASITPEGEELIEKYENDQLPKYPNEAIKKIAKANGVESKEGEPDLSVEDIYNKLKHRQSSGKTNTFESPDIASGLSDIYKSQYEKDPEGFLRMVADQAHEGRMEEGKWISSRPGAEETFGKAMVDEAVAKYPEHIIPEPKPEPVEQVSEEAGQEVPEKPHHTVSTPNIVNIKNKENGTIPIGEPKKINVAEASGDSGKVGEGIPAAGETSVSQAENKNAGEIEQPAEAGVGPKAEADIGKRPEGRELSVKNPKHLPEGTETTGITHAQMDETAREFGLPEYNKDPETVAQWDKQANERFAKDPMAMDKLLGKLREGEQPDKVEQRMMIKYIADLKAKIRENPSNELLTQLKRAKDLSNIVGGREVAKSLVARKSETPVEQSEADFMIQDMEAHAVSELTPEQKRQNIKEFEEIKKAKDELEAKVQKLEADKSKEKAEKVVKEIVKPKQKRSHEDYEKEREDIWKGIKTKWDESKGQLSSTIIPYADRLVKIAPDVAKLMKSYVEEGISELGEIVKNIQERAKEVVPEITEKDIHDIIAGEYKKLPTTKNELQVKLKELKEKARLINKLDALENGQVPKTSKLEIKRNQELESLRKQIGENEIKKLSDFKARTQRRISEIQNELNTRDFSKEEKPEIAQPLKLDAEALELKDKLIKISKDRSIRLAKAEYERMSAKDKLWDKTQNILGLRRAIGTAFDFSIPFRQGLRVTLDPFKINTTIHAFKTMFEHTKSAKEFERWMFDLENAPDYHQMQKDGIVISNPSELRLSKREEQFRFDIAKHIPGFNASQRAAASWINYVRTDLYRKWTSALEHQGFTREKNPEKFEEASKLINNLTGRGHLPKGMEGNPEKILGTVFFGPRLMAAKFNLLSPVYYYNMPKEVRLMALKNLANVAAVYTTIGVLAKLNGWNVSLNADDADFMKLKHGNTRYDITGGEAIYLRTFLRIMQAAKDRVKGTIKDDQKLKDQAKKEAAFAGSSTVNFFRNKLAPNTSYAIDFVSGKNSIGKPFDPAEALKYYPMWIDDIVDDWKQDKESSIIKTGVPSIFGMGVQTYESKEKDEKNKVTPLPNTYK